MLSNYSSTCRLAAAAVAALAPAAGTQAGGLILHDQTRTVEARATALNAEQRHDDANADEASGFGPFTSTVYADAQVIHCSSQSHAAQDSEWVGNRLTATGDVGARSWSAPIGEPVAGSAEGESFLEYTFELIDPTRFALSGDLLCSAPLAESSSSSRVTLVGPSGTIVDLRADPHDVPQIEIDEAGTLDAGVYTLTVTTSTFVASNIFVPDTIGFSSYEVALAVECRGDVDGSGDVDFADILAILAAWGNAGGPEDVDHDGAVGFSDVLATLASWGPCA